MAGKRFRCRLCHERITAPAAPATTSIFEQTNLGQGVLDRGRSLGQGPPPLPRATQDSAIPQVVDWFEPSATYGWVFLLTGAVFIFVPCLLAGVTRESMRWQVAETFLFALIAYATLGWIGALINGAREHWLHALANMLLPFYPLVYTAIRVRKIPTFFACEISACLFVVGIFVLGVVDTHQNRARSNQFASQSQRSLPKPIGDWTPSPQRMSADATSAEKLMENGLADVFRSANRAAQDARAVARDEPEPFFLPQKGPAAEAPTASSRKEAPSTKASGNDLTPPPIDAAPEVADRLKQLFGSNLRLQPHLRRLGLRSNLVDPQKETPVVIVSDDWLRSAARPITDIRELTQNSAVYAQDGRFWKSGRVTRIEKGKVHVHLLGEPPATETAHSAEQVRVPLDWNDNDPFCEQPGDHRQQDNLPIVLNTPASKPLVQRPRFATLGPAETDVIETQTIPASAEIRLMAGDTIWHQRGSDDWYAGRVQVANDGNEVTIGYFDALGFHTSKTKMTSLRCFSPELRKLSPYLETVYSEETVTPPETEDVRLTVSRSNEFVERTTVAEEDAPTGERVRFRIGELVYYAAVEDQWLACRIMAIDRDYMIQIKRLGVTDDEPLPVFKLQLRVPQSPMFQQELDRETMSPAGPRPLRFSVGLANWLGRKVSKTELVSAGERVLVRHNDQWTEGLVTTTSPAGDVTCQIDVGTSLSTLAVARADLLMPRRAF
jgi:hypothetical protein